ncbi:MAG: ATP-binding protein, partial [Cyanobacteriota bacterium]
LEFINFLFEEKAKPILNELDTELFLGIWEGKTYSEITAKTFRVDQSEREAGAKLYKRIKEDLGINVTKRNFKNPIEHRYKQQPSKPASSSQLLNTDNLRMTSPPTPLLRGEGSNSNPFIPQQGKVDNSQHFFDRDREIRRVFEVLNSGSSVALIGEEGIGKSSLLWKICQLAESYLQSPRQSVFLDLNWVNDENDFYSALCHEVGIPESNDYRLTRNLRDRRILLAIDNVGKMTWVGFTRGVRDRLRGLAEGSNASLKLILAASEPLDSLFNDSQDEGKTSPLAGICQEENIKPWDEANARAFIEARLVVSSVRFTEEEIIQLVRESGGHPRRLMQLCYRTYSRYVESGE